MMVKREKESLLVLLLTSDASKQGSLLVRLGHCLLLGSIARKWPRFINDSKDSPSIFLSPSIPLDLRQAM
jgi:hypothetical protein